MVMFLRIAKSNKKSGTYEYLVISESVYVKGKGSITKNVANLGNIKKFKSENVEGLIDDLIRLFNVEKYALSEQVENLDSLEHGSIIFWQKIWNKIGLSNTIKKMIGCKTNKIKIDVEKYIEIMVVNRCVDPLSKLGATRWVERTCYKVMRGYNELNTDVEYFYRSMDYLLSIKDDLEFALYERMNSLFSINVKLTFYDITSTFFYTNNCSIGKKGYSRDNRSDKEQIVIGVVTSFEGYPIKHYVFEGNTKDETTVIEVVKKLKNEYNIEETTFVGDRGMITKLNLSTIEREGFSYIMGVKIRQSEIYEIIFDGKGLDDDKYQEYNGLRIQEQSIVIKDFIFWKTKNILENSNIKICNETLEQVEKEICSLKDEDKFDFKPIKEIFKKNISNSKVRVRINNLIRKYNGQYENTIRTIICLNEERKSISKMKREIKIQDLSETLTNIFNNEKSEKKTLNIETSLNKCFEGYKRQYKKYFKFLRDKDGKAFNYKLNNEALLKEEKYDGIFVLSTNRSDLEAEKIASSYKNLKEVEMLFDDLKHFVDIRPIRHWIEIRVRAHVLICILALLLKRILEIRYLKGKATMLPLEEVSKSKLIKYKVKFSEKEDRFQTFPKITQTTQVQKELFNLVGIRNPMSLEKFIW